jgi:hypothetical protein
MESDNVGKLRAARGQQALNAGQTKPRPRLPGVAFVIILLMGLVSLAGIAWSVPYYVRSVESVAGLELEMTALSFIDDGNPRADIHFRLHNRSPLVMQIGYYSFILYLNGEQVGTSDSTYLGTDPNVDPAVYGRASWVNHALAPQQALDLEFTLYLHPTKVEIVRRIQGSDPMSWTAKADFRVTSPYARRDRRVELSAGFRE